MNTKTAEITLFGATGYTGQLIAHALAREGFSFRLAGRSAEKLAALADSLPGSPTWLTADALKPSTLPLLFQGTRLLINCAGPFTDIGERVIAQAAMSGTHYLDTTNELGYVFRARSYSEMAKRTGAALVPACAFEVAFGDCSAQRTGSKLSDPSRHEPLDEVNVVYVLKGKGASQGTRRSAVRSLATSWIAYRDGDWTGQVPGGKVRQFPMPGGPRHALSFPSCESITIPAHLPVRRVDTWMATTTGARFWAPVVIPLFARLSRSILRPLILKMASSGGFSPGSALDVGLRSDSPFIIYTQARQAERTCWTALLGQNPYGLTAEIIAYAARQLTQPGYDRSGMLAPAQAFDSQAFLGYAQKNWGVELREGSL